VLRETTSRSLCGLVCPSRSYWIFFFLISSWQRLQLGIWRGASRGALYVCVDLGRIQGGSVESAATLDVAVSVASSCFIQGQGAGAACPGPNARKECAMAPHSGAVPHGQRLAGACCLRLRCYHYLRTSSPAFRSAWRLPRRAEACTCARLRHVESCCGLATSADQRRVRRAPM
jgi:hypothetical protein